MAINELGFEVSEGKEQGKDVETVDANFGSKLGGKCDEYLKWKRFSTRWRSL